jgi:hypothetical protein
MEKNKRISAKIKINFFEMRKIDEHPEVKIIKHLQKIGTLPIPKRCQDCQRGKFIKIYIFYKYTKGNTG